MKNKVTKSYIKQLVKEALKERLELEEVLSGASDFQNLLDLEPNETQTIVKLFGTQEEGYVEQAKAILDSFEIDGNKAFTLYNILDSYNKGYMGKEQLADMLRRIFNPELGTDEQVQKAMETMRQRKQFPMIDTNSPSEKPMIELPDYF